MGSFDIYDDTSPNALYREMTQKKKFFRGGEVTYDQPPAYTALEYSPAMAEEQGMMTRPLQEVLPPGSMTRPMPISTSSFLRRDTYRSGFPHRSMFSGLGSSQTDQARAEAKRVGGKLGIVLTKLADWSDLLDDYSGVIDTLSSKIVETYATGYLTCGQAQIYNRNALYLWGVASEFAEKLGAVDPMVRELIGKVPPPNLFAHEISVDYAVDGSISRISPVLDCDNYGLVNPGAKIQTVLSHVPVGGLGTPWVWVGIIIAAGIMSALVLHQIGEDIIGPMADALSGVDHKKIELEQQLLNAKVADKRAAWIKDCIDKNKQPNADAATRARISNDCFAKAEKLYPYGKLPSSMGIFTKLLIAGGVGTGCYLVWKWWQKHQENR